MFFQTQNFTAELITVVELEWDKVNAHADYRPFHALSFRLEGGATLLSDGKKPLQVGESEIAFVPAKYDFSKRAEHGKIIAVHFTCPQKMPAEMLRFRPANPDFFRSEFIKLYDAWRKKQPGFEYEAKMRFYKIVHRIETEWRNKPSFAAERLSEALDYIHEHFCDGKISLEELSRMCGMSDTYFRRLFVAEFGVTPLRYINSLRMTRIRELLQSRYYTIEGVADECGFNNVNYFSLFVKKETGMSPSLYREKLISEDENRNRIF